MIDHYAVGFPIASDLFDQLVKHLHPYDAHPALAALAASALAQHAGMVLTWLTQAMTPEERIETLACYFASVEQCVLGVSVQGVPPRHTP